MSTASKITLLVTTLATAAGIYSVHYQQVVDREQLHLGIVKDEERQQLKRENLRYQKEQEELANKYRESQNSDAAK